MPDLSIRSTQEEEMDLPSTPPETYARCLRDLARVNAVTLTHRATLVWLTRATRHLPPGQPISILDVACGHGDLLRAIHAWATRHHRAVTLAGIDRNPRAGETARAATPPDMPIAYRTGDVFAHRPTPKPDFIVTSQFTHHLSNTDLVRFLRWIDETARLGWCIVDIQRHRLAYYGFPVLARIARWHRIVRQDGQISVARGFHAGEWRAALAEAHLSAKVAWVFPFRHRIARQIGHQAADQATDPPADQPADRAGQGA